jgi:hypothetical protein
MRFLANGPSIPDDLLIARDEGRVVFFCGAGVSRARAGLSDFFELAKTVIATLGVSPDHPAGRLVQEAREIGSRTGISGLISADRVFGLLEREFLARDIEDAVAKALRPKAEVDLSAHRIMIDLATGPDRRVRLVTTNFDLLFESCDLNLPTSKPPRLPDPLRYEEFEGIIHLHGQVNKRHDGAEGDGFVLSSSEFGRAYLSEGWATQFIRAILEKYYVAFVGYAADDPPVQYLLEALNRSSQSPDRIYAFQSGSIGQAQSQWRHRGVQAIAYEDDRDHEHKTLWDTLAAWARRAQNIEAWYQGVIGLAREGPEQLAPHERGQVAHIVSTLEGARKFSAPVNPPPAEWLCVFDPLIRFSKPGRRNSPGEQGLFLDPFDSYGLDSDPVPPRLQPDDYYTKREIPPDAWNCFTSTRLDRQALHEGSFAGLRGHWATNVPELLPRLRQLGFWIQNVASEPATVWWAAGQLGLHPEIQEQIRFELEHGTKLVTSLVVRRAWYYIFEGWSRQKRDSGLSWYGLKALIDRDGWTNTAVREFALLNRPYLSVSRPFWGGSRPPKMTEQVHLRDLAHFDVQYTQFTVDILIPTEWLLNVVRELRRNLERAVSLELELGGYGLHVCPIEPDPSLIGESITRSEGISACTLFYVHHFRSLVDSDVSAAKQEIDAWWMDDPKVFARLRVFVLGDRRLFSGKEVESLLRDLSDEVFWDSDHQRDMLLMLARRWSDLSSSGRRRIERRLLRGRPQWEGENKGEFVERRSRLSLDRICWLKSQGCGFYFDVEAETHKLQKHAPGWRAEEAETAASSMEGVGGFVHTDTAHAELLTEPLDTLLEKAAILTRHIHGKLTQTDPFAGLASQRPIRALASLTVAAKRGQYPDWAWRTFLNSDARRSDKPRLIRQIAERISRVPADALTQFMRSASEWVLTGRKVLLENFPTQFDQIFAKLMSCLRSEPQSSTRGSRDPDWGSEALNSPVGKLAQAVMHDPQNKGLKAGIGFPPVWISRVDEFLSLDGDLRREALVIFCSSLSWFFFVDSAWAERNLLSALSQPGDDQDAFWTGLFWSINDLSEPLFKRLKPDLLALARRENTGRLDHSDNLSAVLLRGWGTVDKSTGNRDVANEETRVALAMANDAFRWRSLWHLARWANENGGGNWKEQLPIFLSEVWPRQKQAKSSKISAALCDLAFSDNEMFPKLADIILPLLTKADQGFVALPNVDNSNNQIISRYPEKALALLSAVLPDNISTWPPNVACALNQIGEASPHLLTDGRLVELKRRWNAR